MARRWGFAEKSEADYAVDPLTPIHRIPPSFRNAIQELSLNPAEVRISSRGKRAALALDSHL